MHIGKGNWTVDDGRLDLFWWLSAGDVFFDTADCGAVNPMRAVKCMFKRLCKQNSEASVHSWSFP